MAIAAVVVVDLFEPQADETCSVVFADLPESILLGEAFVFGLFAQFPALSQALFVIDAKLLRYHVNSLASQFEFVCDLLES